MNDRPFLYFLKFQKGMYCFNIYWDNPHLQVSAYDSTFFLEIHIVSITPICR